MILFDNLISNKLIIRIFSSCFFLFLIFFCWNSNAQSNIQDVFEKNITLEEDQISAQDLIRELSNRYGVVFRYKDEWLKNATFSFKVKDLPLKDFLNSQFDKVNISILYREPHYVILLKNGLDDLKIQANKIKSDDVVSIGKVNNTIKVALVSGTIYSGETGDVIPGVTITVLDSDVAATSDQFGKYKLNIPVGYHTIKFSSLDSKDVEFAIMINSSGNLDIDLFKDYKELNEVVVSAKAPDDNISSTVAGTERVSFEEVEKMPAFLGEADVIKTITTLPGVNTAGEAGGGFNVRGSGVGANLVLLDQGVVFNTSHLFGLFTVFSADAIQSAELFKGTVPSPYGGRSGSILSTEIKSANKYEFIGKGGIGLISSRANFEIPVIRTKSSLLFNVRAAYPNYILNQVNNDNLKNSESFFGDVTLKYDHKINNNNNIQVTGYSSDDSFSVNGLTYLYNNYVGSFNWSHSLSDMSSFNVGYSYNHFTSSLRDESEEQLSYELNNELINNRLIFKYNYDAFDLHQITTGFEVNSYDFSPGTFSINSSESVLDFTNVDQEGATEYALFIDDEFNIIDNLSLYTGLRYSYFQGGKPGLKTDYQGLEPRISLNYSINKKNSVKLAYNRMYQYIHLISNTAAITPIDIWKLSNDQIKPSFSDQYSLGYFKNFNNNNIETSIELYYKLTDNLIEYKNGAQLFANNNIEEELLQGDGEAYGAELYIKKNKGLLTGFLSYTFSRSLITVDGETEESTINNGEQFPTNFDQPHNLGLFANYQFSRLFDMSLNFTYNTGRAITYPTTRYRYYGVWVANYTNRNSERIPDYHRLDLSFHISPGLKKNKKYEASWTFTLYNLYSRRNAYSIYFKSSNAYNQLDGYKLSIIGQIIPSVTYNFKF